MVTHTGTYVCDKCGKEFQGMEYEVDATAFRDKTPCPYCGSKRSHRKTVLDRIFKKKMNDK